MSGKIKKNKIIYLGSLSKCPKCGEEKGTMYLEGRFRIRNTRTLIFEDFSVSHKIYDPLKYRYLVENGIPPTVAHKRYKAVKRCHLGRCVKNFGGF